jgi:gamma-glutamyltranspeptidase/glutathione hydrolase
LVLAALALWGCAESGPPVGAVGHIRAYFGGLSADEPRATVVGRDVLSAGGSAFDAAVAMYFAMSVAMPSAAGLGGGGVCTLYAAAENKAETLDFRTGAPAATPPAGRWSAAVPGNVRGMFALHARYGRLRWEQLVLPAERLARFGFATSRALAGQIAKASDRLKQVSDARRVFAGPQPGELIGEGATFRRFQLAAAIGRIRTVGPGDLYNGVLAKTFTDGVVAAGGHITLDDMRNYKPVWQPTIERTFADHKMHFAGGVTGGQIGADIWAAMQESGGLGSDDVAGRMRQLYRAARAAYAGQKARADIDFGTAGFVVMDRGLNGIACEFTMNEAFGSGRTAGETDILIARVPSDPASVAAALSPVMIANHNNPRAIGALAGGGDASAPAAAVAAFGLAGPGAKPLIEALAGFRTAPGADSDVMLLERAAGRSVAGAVAADGLRVFPIDSLGRVNLMYCPQGVDQRPDLCNVHTDPRGNGYAINAEEF